MILVVRTHYTALELQSTAQLLRKIREFFLVCECAKYHKYLLPFLKIGILNDVNEVVGNNALEQTEIGMRGCLTCKVGLLGALKEVFAALNRE